MSRISSVLVAAALLFASWKAVAGPEATMPGIIGRVDEGISPKILLLDRDPTGTQIARANDNIAGAKFLRLHLLAVAPSALDGVMVQVFDGANVEVDRVDLSGVVGIREIWSGLISGSEYRVRVSGARQPAGATLLVRDVVHDAKAVEPLSIIGTDDMVEITKVTDPKLRSLARATAKFVFEHDGSSYVCTAFLIGPQRMMTNQHCLEDPTTCKSAIVEFDFDSGEGTVAPPANQRRCVAVKAIDYDLDFAVFDIDRIPPAPAIVPIAFATKSPSAESNLVIVEHPAGQSKRISMTDCKVKSNPVAGRGMDTDFTHSCDTLGGSSGSSVLNTDLLLVGLHHFGQGGEQPKFNRAVRIEQLSARLKQLGLTP